MSGICAMCARHECIGRDDDRYQCDKYLGYEPNCKVENDIEQADSQMTCITLSSYADTEFIRWVDWASRFGQMLEKSQLTEEQKQVVRCVACLEVVE